MPRGKKTKTNKHVLVREIAGQLKIEAKDKWFSKGSTVSASALEDILVRISQETGIPPNHFEEYQKSYWRMIYRSIEGIISSLQIINNPTNNYRLEAFLFLFINAWELLLKAKLIKREKGDKSIIKGKNGNDKTISFNQCLTKIFLKDRDPVRLNLQKIEELRNKAVHLGIPIIPPAVMNLFQAGILNYKFHLKKWFGRSLNDKIPDGMMYLINDIDTTTFSPENTKLTEDTVLFLKNWRDEMKKDIAEIEEGDIEKYAIQVNVQLKIINSTKKADLIATLDPTNSKDANIAVKEIDILNKYPLTYTQLVQKLKEQPSTITKKTVNEMIKKHNIKGDKKFSIYNFKSLTDSNKYNIDETLPKSSPPSLYNDEAVKFIGDKYKDLNKG